SADAALTLGKVDVHQHSEGQLSAHQVLTSVDWANASGANGAAASAATSVGVFIGRRVRGWK
ncbi:MAG: hypothetical protein ABS955_12835, partial [Stenotrophomonas maltophilia]